jgi:hypothetical protein
MDSGTIITSVKDAIAVAIGIIESAEKEVLWLVPAPLLVLAARYEINEKLKLLMQKGGRVRGITAISSPHIEGVRELLESGQEVRIMQNYSGIFMLVGDKSQSISSMNVVKEDLSLDDRIAAFWTDNREYAAYLLSAFDTVWAGSTDAQEELSNL